MAHIIPSDISRLALAGAHRPELKTLRTLKKALPNDFTVFHGVHWVREYQSRTHFGEIDFVVLNRSGDLLFIEQKDGKLNEEEGELWKHYPDGKKNPVNQVHRSINEVRKKFRWRHGNQRKLKVDYLVFLPEYRVRDLNAVGLDASRIVDAPQIESLATRIRELLGAGVATDDSWYRKVHEFFCQTFEVVPDVQAHRDSQEQGFVRHVGPVAALLANLEMAPFRLRFTGTAGSGKSLLAKQFYDRMAGEGKRVLLTCYNRPLAERIRDRVPQGGHVDTFHGFCVAFLKSRGQAPDFDQANGDQEFWRRIPELVTAETIPDAWMFDALIVDEGQDFEQEWFDVLGLFLRKNAETSWFEDPDQNLRANAKVATEGFVGYRCSANYRSPESIARFIRNTLPVEFELHNDLPGMGVGVHGFEKSWEQPKVVARVVQDLVRRGFSHDDIVIISFRGALKSVFSELDLVGGLKLRRFTGEYDAHGNQVLSQGQLTFDSIYRFKGQEAPAVILVDVDPQSDRIQTEERLLYCGMTRATVRLDMVVRVGNALNNRFLKT